VVIRLRCVHDTGDADGSYLGPGVCAILPSMLPRNYVSVLWYDSIVYFIMITILIIVNNHCFVNPLIGGTARDAVRPSTVPYGEHDGKAS
jgi:hypothetical protein